MTARAAARRLAVMSLARAWLATTCLATACLAGGCSGAEGTIALSVVTAPQSDVMDAVHTVRLTLSDPLTVIEAERDAEGRFALALDVTAEGQPGAITFEGLDRSGQVVAYGRTPLLPIAAINAVVAVYVAPPLSLAEAPVALEPARAELGAAALPYGAILMGGRTAGGQVAGHVDVYNVYSHALQPGLDVPEARAHPVVMAGSAGAVYLFGGVDGQDQAAAEAWRFDTSVAPAGVYTALATDSRLARAGASAAPLPQGRFVITGDPVAVLDGPGLAVSELAGAPAVAVGGTATTIVVDDAVYTLFVGAGSGASGGVLLAGDDFVELDAPAEMARTGHSTVALPDDTVLVIGGEAGGALLSSAVRVTVTAAGGAAGAVAEAEAEILATPRRDAAVAVTAEYVIVAGGMGADGAIVADAEVLDAATLAPVATLPLVVPRQRAHALALANGQVLIAGGVDAGGQPIAALELFTPAP